MGFLNWAKHFLLGDYIYQSIEIKELPNWVHRSWNRALKHLRTSVYGRSFYFKGKHKIYKITYGWPRYQGDAPEINIFVKLRSSDKKDKNNKHKVTFWNTIKEIFLEPYESHVNMKRDKKRRDKIRKIESERAMMLRWELRRMNKI